VPFYRSPMQEHGITDVPKRAPALIERLRSSVDRSIARLREEPISKATLKDAEEEEAVA